MNERLEASAQLYEEAAKELDIAARHCEVAAQHVRDNLVPRGAAHAWSRAGIWWRPGRSSTSRLASTVVARASETR